MTMDILSTKGVEPWFSLFEIFLESISAHLLQGMVVPIEGFPKQYSCYPMSDFHESCRLADTPGWPSETMPLLVPYWQLNYFKWDGQDAGITTWMRMLQQRPPRRQYRCADLFVRVHVLRIVRDGSPAGYLPKLWWRAGSKTQEVAGQVGRQSGFNKACTQARWLPHERLT